jgi:tetratricopeptide (TPR) repeat protein
MTQASEARCEAAECSRPETASFRALLIGGWIAAIGAAAGVRLWNALAGALMWGYDAWGHVAYVLFIDIYRAVPWADQGWSYFHPPFHYGLGWLLAQFGTGEVLMRGLSLLGSAASLGTAALAAWLARLASPSRPALALLAFSSVAFLPVHFFMSPMPGNEMTETCLTAASIAALIANETRTRPGLLAAAGIGVVMGLALLTKFSGLLPLAVALATLGLRPLLAPSWRGELGPAAARAALLAAVALAIAAPYYIRNVRTFGTPFQLSRDFSLVAEIERDQPPGSRSWKDYVSFSPGLFADPNPLAPHMLHSVWGTVYLNVWADSYRESDVTRALEAEREERRSSALMAALGLVPTALALVGAVLAARDVRRGRRRSIYLPLLLLSGATLGSFAVFAWWVPLWSALKSSYLLALSLPYALFLARCAEALASRRARWQRAGVPVAVAAVALAAAVVAPAGAVLPTRADAPATGAVRFYFGEYADARRVYGRLVAGAPYPVPWLENLAAVDLADGRTAGARRLYRRAVALARSKGRSNPRRGGQLAVATALDGDPELSLRLFDEILASDRVPELLANRGAVRAALGDLAGAEGDMRAGLDLGPAMLPAWRNLSAVLESRGRPEEAARALRRAAREACRAPRGYPYGLGTGEVIEWGVGRRWLLLLEAQGLRVALPSFYRQACRRLGDEANAGLATGAE